MIYKTNTQLFNKTLFALATLTLLTSGQAFAQADAGALQQGLEKQLPLPNWIRFDVATKTFVADQVPDNIPDIKIKIIAIQADTVVGQAEIAIQIKQ